MTMRAILACVRGREWFSHGAVPHALSYHTRVKLCAWPWCTRLRHRIKLKQSKAKVPALIPFKVVRQRPMEVAAQVYSFRQQSAHLSNNRLNHPRTNPVLAVRHAILQNVDRLFEFGKM